MFVPRWQQIANAIQADISAGKLTSGEALPSETELAAQWSVSRVTAHRAMHELQQQGIVHRKRRKGTVVAARKALGTGRIAVFVNTGDFLEQEYLAGIRVGLPDEYDLLYCDIRNDPQREAYYLKRMTASTDGIICIPTCDPHNVKLFLQLLQTGTSIVCVDRKPDNIRIDAVVSDNLGASREALQFLAARGHQRIAHFTEDRLTLSSLRERYEAYKQVMLELGVTDTTPLVRGFPFNLTGRLGQIVRDALFVLLHLPLAERPTALFCANDYILSAVLQECQTLDIAVPGDLEIVSFYDCPPLVPYLPNNVHRIVQCARAIGKVAAERLCRDLSDETASIDMVRIAPIFYPAQGALQQLPGSETGVSKV